MSEQRQPIDRDAAAPRSRMEMSAAFAAAPASFWLASLASLGIIIGGVGPWATAFGMVSLSGTSMHGWRSVMVGLTGLAMLGLHLWSRARLPLVVAAAAAALAALQAILTWDKINSGGAVTVLGQQYRYLSPAWGLDLVFAGAIGLMYFGSALIWRASRAGRTAPAATQPLTPGG